MTWRRNHKRIRRVRQQHQIRQFVESVEYSNSKKARDLIRSGWRPDKDILDNYKPWRIPNKAMWEYLYKLSAGDPGSTPGAQDSQVLGVAQNRGAPRSSWFGEPQHSSSTQIVGWG